jgi:hypothetical protein
MRLLPAHFSVLAIFALHFGRWKSHEGKRLPLNKMRQKCCNMLEFNHIKKHTVGEFPMSLIGGIAFA